MKIPRFGPKQKLRATARRMPQRAMEEFGGEPNMSFSKALGVVVILHIVAVGGIIAFNSIKAHKISSTDPVLHPANAVTEKADEKTETDPSESVPKTVVLQTLPAVNSHVYQVKAGDTLVKIAANLGVRVESLEEANGLKNIGALRVGQELKIPVKPVVKPVVEVSKQTETAAKKTADEAAKPVAAKGAGETYIVAKGDNPVAIARKFHVSYDALLKLNKIEDPKKLKIGQKLKIPTKTKMP